MFTRQLSALAVICAAWVGIADSARASPSDIVATAKSAGGFSTLVAALDATGLDETLAGEGPFTVFAPTDDAFAALDASVTRRLLDPAGRDTLATVLKYHVLSGTVKGATAATLTEAETLAGQTLEIGFMEGRLAVDGAMIVKTDIACSNGVIHVIDAVLMPETSSIVEVARSAGNFSTLLAALEAADLATTLSADGPFTVLAPTDAAFDALPAGTLDALLRPENREALTTILTYHVIKGRVEARDAVEAKAAKTLAGDKARFGLRDGRLVVNESDVIATNMAASNGVVHVIDAVLLPPGVEIASAAAPGRLIIGVFTGSIGEALAAQIGVERDEALLVESLVDDGPAERAGLRPFDVIVAVDGRPATSENLADAKQRAGFGNTVELEIVRRARRLVIDVPVGAEEH